MGTEAAELELDPAARPQRWRRVLVRAVGAAAGLALVAVVALLLVGEQLVEWAGSPHRADRELQAAIEGAFEDAEGHDVVVLEDVTDFEWDAVGVFGPYTSHDEVVEQLGIRVPQVVTDETMLDDHCLLVFRGGDRMVRWTTVGRGVAECVGTGVHSPDEARFVADSFRPAVSN